MAISKNSGVILRKLHTLKEAELAVLAKEITEFPAKDAINSLTRQGFIEVVKILTRKLSGKRNKGVKEVRILAISEKGLRALETLDNPKPPPVKVSRPSKAEKPAKTLKTERAPKQVLHQMQNLIIPERDPDVEVDYIEVEGRKVKITYGKAPTRKTYVPPKDCTRYKPGIIRGIHAK